MGLSSYIDRDKRVERVYELIGEGYLTFQIHKIMRDEFGISLRTAQRYFAIVKKFLAENNVVDKDKTLLLYEKKALKYENAGKDDLAFKYRQQIDRITGLSEKSTLDINVIEVKINPPKKRE